MKIVLILVMSCCLSLFPFIDSKLHRVMLEDKILPYIDNSVVPLSDIFNLDNLILEQVDDDNIQVGGYLEAKKSMNRNLPLVANLRTQFYEKAVWNDAPYRVTLPNACLEFINPEFLFYNITKLWTLDLCPANIGDKWEIESKELYLVYDVPSAMPIVPWRIYVMVTQGLLGFENIKYGYGLEVQFLSIK